MGRQNGIEYLVQEACRYADKTYPLHYALRAVETAFLINREPAEVISEIRDFTRRCLPPRASLAVATNAYYLSALTNDTLFQSYTRIKAFAEEHRLEIVAVSEMLINAELLFGSIMRKKNDYRVLSP